MADAGHSRVLTDLFNNIREYRGTEEQEGDTGNLSAILYTPRSNGQLVSTWHLRAPFVTKGYRVADNSTHVFLKSEQFSAIFVCDPTKISFEEGFRHKLVGVPNHLVTAQRVVLNSAPKYGSKRGTKLFFYDSLV